MCFLLPSDTERKWYVSCSQQGLWKHTQKHRDAGPDEWLSCSSLLSDLVSHLYLCGLIGIISFYTRKFNLLKSLLLQRISIFHFLKQQWRFLAEAVNKKKNPMSVFLCSTSPRINSIFLLAAGDNTLLICPIYCVFHNPPVRRGAGRRYATLQHFSAAFDFTHSSIPLSFSLLRFLLIPLSPLPRFVSLTFLLCLRLFPVILCLSLSLSLPRALRGFTPHCGHKSFTAPLFLPFAPLLPSFSPI